MSESITLSHAAIKLLLVLCFQQPGRAPIFTRKMQPSRAFETNGARLDVDFVGVPPPEITWFREDFPIKPSHDFKVSPLNFSTSSSQWVIREATTIFFFRHDV